MHTLALSGGDLVATASGHLVIDGAAMVRQNLACALAEPVGTDRFHPGYGSTLSAQVGTPLTVAETATVRAEAVRVVQALIAAQGAAISADAAAGARSRFSASDVIARLVDVVVTPNLDRASVLVKIQTGSGAVLGSATMGAP
jgi:hypothetical protein